MTDSFVERELKFDVQTGFVVPDVANLLPHGGRIESSVEHLCSDYFDTADQALLRAGMTLRRRSGSTDTGWQLKVPHEPFREEIRAELLSAYVPQELLDMLRGISRGQRVVQTASLRTQRTVTRLLDGSGRMLAEIDDDTVDAFPADESVPAHRWREVEVELGHDDHSEDSLNMLAALDTHLRQAGARPSAASSKIARALAKPSANAKKKRKLHAGDLIAAYLAEQQRVILTGDLALRRGDEGAIHKTRVATRRLRSTLRSFHTFVDRERATSLDAELQWYAALLGEVRDRHVLQQRLDTMAASLDDSMRPDAIRAVIDAALCAELDEHWRVLQAALIVDRYLALLADIDDWVRNPPWTTQAQKPARNVPRAARKAEKKVSKRLEHAVASGDIHQMHGVRKAAKRARYAAEAAQDAKGHGATVQALLELLGEHQDSLTSAAFLQRLGASTEADGSAFALGILYENEQRTARLARKKARRVAKKRP
ncbi:CYTH and CHAD domain-containing protein [soil metagenome]